MEEDIKILEEFAHDLMQDYIYSQDEIPQCDRRLKQAIENLIARYKELEEYYKNEKVIWSRKDYIPKSKIKEKIEELKKENDFKVGLEEYTIRILQELLEES